jgi:hypothetical protein
MDDGTTLVPMFVAVMSVMVVGVLFAVSLVLDKEEYMINVQSAAEIIASCLVLHHSKWRSAGAGCGQSVCRRYIKWDHERAQRCIVQDYLCAIPAFSLDDFKCIFQVSQSSYDSIHNYLCGMVPFFCDGLDVTHHRRVTTDAKILISLKYLAYGCSINAFWDYFQLGESTAMLCIRKFTSSIANSMFQKKFFSFLMASDAK